MAAKCVPVNRSEKIKPGGLRLLPVQWDWLWYLCPRALGHLWEVSSLASPPLCCGGIFQKDKATESFTFLTSVVSPLTSQAKGTIQHCGTVTKNHEDLTQCPLESYEPPQCSGPAMSNSPIMGLSAWLMFLLVIWDPGVGSTCTEAHKTQSTHPEPTQLEEGSGE